MLTLEELLSRTRMVLLGAARAFPCMCMHMQHVFRLRKTVRGLREAIFPSFQILETGWLELEFLSASWKLTGWPLDAVS